MKNDCALQCSTHINIVKYTLLYIYHYSRIRSPSQHISLESKLVFTPNLSVCCQRKNTDSFHSKDYLSKQRLKRKLANSQLSRHRKSINSHLYTIGFILNWGLLKHVLLIIIIFQGYDGLSISIQVMLTGKMMRNSKRR